MKTVVLGATGFLGRHVVASLVDSGHQVRGLSRRGGRFVLPHSAGLARSGEQSSSVEAAQGAPFFHVESVDQLDLAALSRSLTGADVLLVCSGRVSRSPLDAEVLHRFFVEGTKIAVEAAIQAGVRRIVLTSSSGTLALGSEPERIYCEEQPASLSVISRFPYYRAKYFGERAALEAAEGKLELVIANPSLLLGPGDHAESSTGDVRRFLDGVVPVAPAGGLSFVDVRDAARGIVLAAELGQPGQRYLLSAVNMTVRRFLERLARMTGIVPPRWALPQNPQLALGLFDVFERAVRAIGGTPPVDRETIELAQFFFYCSSVKAERELGFQTRDPGETLYDTVSDLVERRIVVCPPAFAQRAPATNQGLV